MSGVTKHIYDRDNKDKRPQDVQKEFSHYEELIEDLTKTNTIMIGYCSELEKIAFYNRQEDNIKIQGSTKQCK